MAFFIWDSLIVVCHLVCCCTVIIYDLGFFIFGFSFALRALAAVETGGGTSAAMAAATAATTAIRPSIC